VTREGKGMGALSAGLAGPGLGPVGAGARENERMTALVGASLVQVIIILITRWCRL
jgi:hypothetical protein